MEQMTTITTPEGSITVTCDEAHILMESTPYRPKYGKLRQLAYLRPDYKGKNENGGRKCTMRQSADYKKSHIGIVAWPGFKWEGNFRTLHQVRSVT